jgi:hypothetical protein
VNAWLKLTSVGIESLSEQRQAAAL